MLGLASLRRRMFLTILLVALVPAAGALLGGLLMLSEAGATTGTLGPWERVASSGEALAAAALLAAPDDEALAVAARTHRVDLSQSLLQSRRWTYVADRFLRRLPQLAVASLIVIALLAFGSASWLARSFSGPIQELVGWSELIARSEPLPEAGSRGRGVAEFQALRSALRDMADRLAQARRREVDEARLRAWNDMARRVAHELKNPLTPMKLAAATLARRPEPEVAESASAMLEEVTRLDEMARTFSQFGRMPEGAPSEVDLGELLGTLAERHGGSGTSVRVVAPEGALVHGYYDVLERAFRNVLVNALEAVEGGGGSAGRPDPGHGGRADEGRGEADAPGSTPVDVEVVVEPGDGGVAVFVRDRGRGIPDELLETLWMPDVTTKRSGTGLGLAIVRQGIEAHGGTVSARNREGGGAEIEIRLPRGPSASAAAGAPEEVT